MVGCKCMYVTDLLLGGGRVDGVHALAERELHVLVLRGGGPRRGLLRRQGPRGLLLLRQLLQALQRLVREAELVLLHDALLHDALLHLDVLVHGQLVDGVQRAGGGGVGRRQSLPLDLRALQRLVQPLHRVGALAEVVHGCVGACRPSRATPASTGCSGESRGLTHRAWHFTIRLDLDELSGSVLLYGAPAIRTHPY
ncbi:unnamed protein product [Danaus chrysippus]|uniref:(African queen) hypothetical protein n=1 Tax=Danaus chrysippus TaxID=151541 RepID=A0A8J2QHE1_9NEOP|nr:unnamed protein product [Danaus chrysippus]